MEFMKRLEPVFLLLVILGALNWLLIGLFELNLVAEIFGGGTVADVVYVLVGLAGIMLLPRLMDAFSHMGEHRVRPYGA